MSRAKGNAQKGSHWPACWSSNGTIFFSCNGQLAGQMASLLVFKWPACWSSNGQLAGLQMRYSHLLFTLQGLSWMSLPSAQKLNTGQRNKTCSLIVDVFSTKQKPNKCFFSTRASSARALLQRDASSAWGGMPTKLDMPMQCDLVKVQTINI